MQYNTGLYGSQRYGRAKMAGNYQFSLFSRVSDVIAGPLGGSNTASAEIKYQRAGDISTNPYAGTHALVGGAATLNLGSLTAIGGGSLNLTGAVVRGIVVENSTANPITFAEGATNGFPIPDLEVKGNSIGAVFSRDAGGFGTVAVADITIDVTGTGTDSFKIILITDEAP